jgi:Holliday junction resolvasome RuvABC ATP-dependent DNA helicase subunit
LPEPLLDRLTEISLSKYNNDELFEIFKNNLPKAIAVIDTMKGAVSKTFRGHPRDAVAKAEELKDFLSANGKTFLTPDAWTKFKSDMGVYDFGLSPAEIRVLKPCIIPMVLFLFKHCLPLLVIPEVSFNKSMRSTFLLLV